MLLTPWEEERLLIFAAAELARRHRVAGLQLNAPEAVALICDAMLEAARAGASYEEVEAAGRAAVAPGDVMPGIAALVPEVRLEVLLGDGTRLIVLLDPLRPPDAGREADATDATEPGAIRFAEEPGTEAGAAERASLERRSLVVENMSRRVVRVSSHFPFDRVNRRLVFDRGAARGFHLDLEAGSSERWSPGESREVVLVRYGGGAGR